MNEAVAVTAPEQAESRPKRSRPAAEPVVLQRTTVESPIGPLTLMAREGALCGLAFGTDTKPLVGFLERRFRRVRFEPHPDPAGAASALRDYFAGNLRALDGLTLDPGGTPFQSSVWAALRRIPLGHTASYGEVATAIGSPKAVRAVGLANGANPLAIVVPCHRVVASTGALHGYGGGLDRKAWLLRHERAIPG